MQYLAGFLRRWFIINPKNWGMIQFDEHMFQMGWFNHQLVMKRSMFLIHLRAFQMCI